MTDDIEEITGRPVNSTNGPIVSVKTFLFSNQLYDPRTVLLHYLYRVYSPNLQRWLNKDPIEEEGGINLYGLTGNDLIDYFDPFGLKLNLTIPDPTFLKKIPLLGGMINGVATIATGAVNTTLGVVTVGYSGTLKNGANQITGGLNATVIGTADVCGKAWALPNTAIGLVAGGVSYGFGNMFTTNKPTISLGNNAIQFVNLPWGDPKSALTLGNIQLYHDSTPSTWGPRYDLGPGLVQYGPHEEAHTYQNEVLGPFFLPVYFIRGGIPTQGIPPYNPLEISADNYTQKIGGWWK